MVDAKKIKLIVHTLMILGLSLWIAGCEHTADSGAKTGTAESTPPLAVGSTPSGTGIPEGYATVEKKEVDMDQNGVREEVTLLEKVDHGLHVMVQRDGGALAFEVPGGMYAEWAGEARLEKGRKALVVRVHYNQREATVQNPIDRRETIAVVGDQSGRWAQLLNTWDQLYQKADNYEIVYKGNRQVAVTDRATGFAATVPLKVPDAYRQAFESYVADADLLRGQSSPSLWYVQTIVEDTDRDGVDEVRCIKTVPSGYNRNQPFGYIEYTFVFKQDGYILNQERFFTAEGSSLLNPETIKTVKF